MGILEAQIGKVFAIVYITSFAIQQLLEIFDPLISAGIKKIRDGRTNKDFPGGQTEEDFKKSVMNLLSFIVAGLVVGLSPISILEFVHQPWKGGFTDWLISALVVGAGTESTNILMKYFGYVKDARKPPPEVEIVILPSPAATRQGSTIQFSSVVKNTTNPNVNWSVIHGAGGTITAGGLYTAPAHAGTYQVMATSQADLTKFVIANVTVT